MPPMQIQKRHLSRHRRQRLVLWALAMLTWIASVFAGKAISLRHAHQRGDISLDWITRMVMQLAIIRAGELARLRRRRPTFFKRGRDLRRRHLLRSVIGSRLRRKLKHKDLATRIAILIAALRDLDSIARPLAQRMRRGLARLWAITAGPMLADITLEAPPSPPALADSS
jgi:hypothetical protein